MKNTKSERGEKQHDHDRAAIKRLPERGERECATGGALHRGIEGKPGDDAGQSDAGGHVIVDADHVGAQACIDRDSTRGAEAAGSYVTVVVRHRSFLSYVPALRRSRHARRHSAFALVSRI